MANRLQSAGTDLDSLFQSYVSGDIIQTTTTNIQNGGTDISSRYAGRDNKLSNAASNVNLTYGGTNISGLFNKSGATYDVGISGTTIYNGTGQTPTLTHDPTNTPILATISSQTNVGTYTPANFTITLPGNYSPGTYSGTFVINRKPVTANTWNYYYDSFAQFVVWYSVNINGGPPSAPFDNFRVLATGGIQSDLPQVFSDIFDLAGVYIYNLSPPATIFLQFPGERIDLRFTANNSTNYSGIGVFRVLF